VNLAELLADQWWSTVVEGVTQGAVYVLLALACTRRARAVDLAQPAAFALGLFAAYLTYLALGFRPGPTPDVGVLPLLAFLALGLLAALAVAALVSAATGRLPLPLGLAAFAVVEVALWLLLGNDAEPPVRLFRPHELLPGVDDVQVAVVVLAAAAIAVALRRGAAAWLLSGTAAFLDLLKVPGSAWYLTAVLVGVYAVTAAVVAGSTRGVIVTAAVLGIAQVCFETVVGPRWWLPFSLGLLVLACAVRLVKARWGRTRARVEPVAA
jgi:branched-chain amino acid transport system permease protein